MPVTRTLSEDGVLTVALARPEQRNAIDAELAASLRDAFESAAGEAAVRAVILTGEGPAFSAGGDLSRFEREWDPREFRHDSHRLTQLVSLVERLEKPTVAAINGLATGAGTQLALACDVRLIAASARFLYREGRLGIIPSHGGVTRLVKLIGLGRARDVLLGGEQVTAQEALRLGMVTAVVDDGHLLSAAHEQAGLMLARSPQAYAAAKRLLWLAANVDLESGMVIEGLAQSQLIGTPEHKQAVEEARWRR
jgi:enoyl-CoA hydratase/carnithine racemase